MLELSRAYEKGEYLQCDMEKAASWRREAAEAGNEEANRLVYENMKTASNEKIARQDRFRYGDVMETEASEKITRWKRRQGIVKVEQPVRTLMKLPVFWCGFCCPPTFSAAELRRYMRYTQADAGQRSSKPTGQRLV